MPDSPDSIVNSNAWNSPVSAVVQPDKTQGSDLSGQQLQAPQTQAPQQPLQLEPGVPPITASSPNVRTHTFIARAAEGLLTALAGKPGPTYNVDPATGKMVATAAPPMTTADKVKRIANTFATGLAAASRVPNQRSGLANVLAGFGAGFGAVQNQETQADKEAQEKARADYDEQQKSIIRKAELAKGNALTYTTLAHLHREQIDRNEIYSMGKAAVSAMESERIPVERLTGDELATRFHKTPGQLVTEGKILPIGEREMSGPNGEPVVDPETQAPRFERLYAYVPGMHSTNDGPARFKLPKEFSDYVAKYGPYATDARFSGGDLSGLENSEVDIQQFNRLHNAAAEGQKSVLAGWAKPEAVETEDGHVLAKNPITSETREATSDQVASYWKNQKAAGRVMPIDIYKEQQENYRAGLKAKRDAESADNIDVFGNKSNLPAKEFNKRYDAFNNSKQYQTLKNLQGSYQQFQQTLDNIDAGKGMTGAESVVALFNAIGISATPLAGKGFRINENTIKEHQEARGWDQAAYQKLLKLKEGDVITEKQVKDYAAIAAGVYRDSYVNAANEQKRQLGYIDVLPLGNNEVVDPMTAGLYLKIAGGDRAKAEAALKKSGWIVPGQ